MLEAWAADAAWHLHRWLHQLPHSAPPALQLISQPHTTPQQQQPVSPYPCDMTQQQLSHPWYMTQRPSPPLQPQPILQPLEMTQQAMSARPPEMTQQAMSQAPAMPRVDQPKLQSGSHAYQPRLPDGSWGYDRNPCGQGWQVAVQYQVSVQFFKIQNFKTSNPFTQHAKVSGPGFEQRNWLACIYIDGVVPGI